MPRRQDEAVAVEPPGLLGIVGQRVPKQDRAHFGAAEREPEMARRAGVDGVDREAPGLVGGFGKDIGGQAHGVKSGPDLVRAPAPGKAESPKKHRRPVKWAAGAG